MPARIVNISDIRAAKIFAERNFQLSVARTVRISTVGARRVSANNFFRTNFFAQRACPNEKDSAQVRFAHIRKACDGGAERAELSLASNASLGKLAPRWVAAKTSAADDEVR
jgi:hypothetical protein